VQSPSFDRVSKREKIAKDGRCAEVEQEATTKKSKSNQSKSNQKLASDLQPNGIPYSQILGCIYVQHNGGEDMCDVCATTV